MKRLRFALCLIVILALQATSNVSLAKQVTVTLFEAHSPVNSLLLDGPFEIQQPVKVRLPEGQYRLMPKDQRLKLESLDKHPAAKIPEANRYLLQGLSAQGLGVKTPAAPQRRYSGRLDVTVNSRGRLLVKNHVEAQEYMMAVVGSETLSGWPLEALKAQAVLTQTRLAKLLQGDPLGDSTQQEAYLGSSHIRPEVRQAVLATWGQTLSHDNRPITPYYHAACGGKTSTVGFFSGLSDKSALYLKAVDCHYCRNSPFWKNTQTRIPKAVFQKAFGSGLPQVLAEDEGSRPRKVKLGNGDLLSGYHFWLQLGQQLGWDKAPGTRYRLTQQDRAEIVIISNGAGHGVGLCQWGAAEQARQGKTYRQILSYYFPNTQLTGDRTDKANEN